jgi:malonyl-ACP decarboxylase
MILVTGVGVRASIGRDRESFAAALMAGRTAFTRTGGHWSTAPLDHAPPDAPPGHPNAAKALARATPAAALSCAVVLEAWTHARLDTAPLAPDRIGIVLAGHNLTDGYLDRTRDHYERDPRHQDARFALRRYDTDHLGTVSELLGLRGPGHSVGAASASGNLAVMAAANLIATGAADACLVVGPAVEPTDRELHGYHNVGALAADEPCRPFDAGTTGFTPGRAAAAADRPASQIVREFMREYVQQDRDYVAWLQRKVDQSRRAYAEGRWRTNEEVEVEFSKKREELRRRAAEKRD